MRLYWNGAALALLLLAGLAAAKEEAKKEDKKELLMVELERVEDTRDKRQTEGEVDFASKEVPPEYLSLLQQLQLQNGEQAQLQSQPDLQQYYIAKTPSGVISGGPLDRSPQRFLPAPGEPRPFRPRDPVLQALSRQNSELQAEYQRKALRDQETVFLMPRGPQGADPPRAGPLALSGLYRPGAQPPSPPQGIPVAPGSAVGLAAAAAHQPAQATAGPLPAYSAHEARLRAALQGAEVIQSQAGPQLASQAELQQLQARGLAHLSGGPAGELSLVREAAQLQQQHQQQQQLQLQARQPAPQYYQQLQLQRQPQRQPQPQPQPQQLNYHELSPAELRFLQRQQQPEPQPQPQYVLQPAQPPQPISQGEAEEQYLRETTPGGPPPLPAHAIPAPAPAPQHSVLQPSPLYLQQVQQLAEQQQLAQQQLAAQHQLAAQQQQQQQQQEDAVQYIRQPAPLRYAPQQVAPKSAPAPQPQQSAVPITTPRSSIYVSTAASQPSPKPLLRRPSVTIEQLLGPEEPRGKSQGPLPVVRLPSPAEQKPLTQADLQQLIDAGFDVSPVGEVNPTANAYYRSSAAGDYSGGAVGQHQSFAPIVVPDEPAPAPIPRLSARQRQALAQAQAQQEAYLQSRGVRLGSSGN